MAIKRIKASTLAEFVIALSIFAICFGIASMIFTQSNRSTIQFQEANEQTAFQSQLFEAFINDTLIDPAKWEGNLASIEITPLTSTKGAQLVTLQSSSKDLWKQDQYPTSNAK